MNMDTIFKAKNLVLLTSQKLDYPMLKQKEVFTILTERSRMLMLGHSDISTIMIQIFHLGISLIIRLSATVLANHLTQPQIN